MIHLDTNYLIGLLVKGSLEARNVEGWIMAGQTIATSAISWTEFLNGPATSLEVSRVEAVLQSQVIPLEKWKLRWRRICSIRQDDGAVPGLIV